MLRWQSNFKASSCANAVNAGSSLLFKRLLLPPNGAFSGATKGDLGPSSSAGGTKVSTLSMGRSGVLAVLSGDGGV